MKHLDYEALGTFAILLGCNSYIFIALGLRKQFFIPLGLIMFATSLGIILTIILKKDK